MTNALDAFVCSNSATKR